MKIAKALKLKNQLAGEVGQLKELDKLVAESNSEIQSLQDALDEFNFTRSVNL
jgi:hypothetical protein